MIREALKGGRRQEGQRKFGQATLTPWGAAVQGNLLEKSGNQTVEDVQWQGATKAHRDDSWRNVPEREQKEPPQEDGKKEQEEI